MDRLAGTGERVSVEAALFVASHVARGLAALEQDNADPHTAEADHVLLTYSGRPLVALSPLNALPVDARTKTFSVDTLSALLFELLTNGASRGGQGTDILDFRDDVPAGVQSLLFRMQSSDITERPQSYLEAEGLLARQAGSTSTAAAELAEIMGREFDASLPELELETASAPKKAGRGKSRSRRVAAALVLAGLLVALITVLSLRDAGEPKVNSVVVTPPERIVPPEPSAHEGPALRRSTIPEKRRRPHRKGRERKRSGEPGPTPWTWDRAKQSD